MPDIAKAIALQEQLIVCERRKAELLREIGRALHIQALWPEVFEAGPVKTFWKGRHVNTGAFRKTKYIPEALVVTTASGDRREFPISEVPEELHPKEQ